MAHIAPCKRLVSDFRPLADFLAEVSRETGHEMATTICQRADGTLYPELLCVGNECGIRIKHCPPGEKGVFNIHTHPIAPNPALSPDDITMSLNNGYPSCVISATTGKVGCLFGVDETTWDKVDPRVMDKMSDDVRQRLYDLYEITEDDYFEMSHEEKVNTIGLKHNIGFLNAVLEEYPFLRYCESSLND